MSMILPRKGRAPPTFGTLGKPCSEMPVSTGICSVLMPFHPWSYATPRERRRPFLSASDTKSGPGICTYRLPRRSLLICYAAEALRDNSLAVGQELFASRMRAMSAMGYVSKRMISLLNGAPPPPFTLTHAIAFDQNRGEMRTYDLSTPGEHPELPYDPLTYDPHEP